jgi:bacterioferritin (cytochrome b1)
MDSITNGSFDMPEDHESVAWLRAQLAELKSWARCAESAQHAKQIEQHASWLSAQLDALLKTGAQSASNNS